MTGKSNCNKKKIHFGAVITPGTLYLADNPQQTIYNKMFCELIGTLAFSMLLQGQKPTEYDSIMQVAYCF